MNICTIICGNYRAQARVLARSFRDQYPDGRCVVLVVDASDDLAGPNDGFDVVTLAALEIPLLEQMRGRYDAIEFSTAVKPWLLRWMLRQFGDIGPIAYFDPDIRFYSRMTELESMLARTWIALTPHLLTGMPLDGKTPDEQALLLAGVYNLGFIGLSKSEISVQFLDWWEDRLARQCIVQPEDGFFVDQRFIDFVPGLFDDVGILRNPGYNVAYWNLAGRSLSGTSPGEVLVNGTPLRFFHFSGFDPRRAGDLSKHQNRVDPSAKPLLKNLLRDYAAELLADGYEEFAQQSYGNVASASGKRLTKTIRRIYGKQVDSGFSQSLYDLDGEAAFSKLLAEPANKCSALELGLSALWDERVELQRRFPDPGGRDRAAFRQWASDEDVWNSEFGGLLLRDLAPRAQGQRQRPPGVNVVGYLRAELGVGEAARQLVAALDASDIPTWPISQPAPNSRNDAHFIAPTIVLDLPFTNTLLCVNADMLPTLAESLVPVGLSSTHRVGYWWWETSVLPTEFMPAFDHVDEVWAGTSFVADAIGRVSPVPVRTIPLPVHVPSVHIERVSEVDWPSVFTFYFSWDYNSIFERKNPLGVIRAFTEAFRDGEGPVLVLKCINHEQHVNEHEQVLMAVRGRSDVRVIDRYVDSATRIAMASACDCYVSLHRSEGFGLTIAEAMYLRKPVIATGFSGNMDFMTETNSVCVPYSLVPIGETNSPYQPDELWAEPDESSAAASMRKVVSDGEWADRLGERAAADIRRTHSRAATSIAICDALGIGRER
jgi:hypothetical protein